MPINFKTIYLFTLIFFGLYIFFNNISNLNLKKNIIFSEAKVEEIQNKETFKLSKKQAPTLIATTPIDNSITNLNEEIFTVKKGQTFSEILDNFIFKFDKFEIINLVNNKFDLKSLKVNQKISFFSDENQIIQKIIIDLDFKTKLIVNLSKNLEVTKKELNTQTDIESKEYIITNSLYADGVNSNVPNEVLVKLIQLFSFDLDFQRDIKKNTAVSISYEKTYVENASEFSIGDIDYAKIEIGKNNLEYFKFLTDEGFIDYFNREGKNVKKSILKTPLDGARLSSNFGMRKHPISGFNKMHKGIDFAAPIGTPIYAGGNGIVEYVGTNGGYGKYIRIRHNNEYKTAYAHLNSYKKGISKGVRVNQGEVIGYVGNTGRSTGPHLHYEIIYQNKQINPLTLKLPSGKILKGEELKRFEKNYKMILANHLNNLYE
jgi:murein DD-endopeptidase MepM/ murein hydrolase activator NlpD